MSDSTPPYDQVIYIINNGGSGNYVAVQGSLALQDEPIVLHAKTGMDNQMVRTLRAIHYVSVLYTESYDSSSGTSARRTGKPLFRAL